MAWDKIWLTRNCRWNEIDHKMHRVHEYFIYIYSRYNTNDYIYIWHVLIKVSSALNGNAVSCHVFYLPRPLRTNASHYASFHDVSHKILDVKKLQMHSASHENYIAVCYFLYARRDIYLALHVITLARRRRFKS